MPKLSPAFRSRLKAYVPAINQEVRETLKKEASRTVNYMKLLAPVETGELRESIRYEFDRDTRVTLRAGDETTTVQNTTGQEFQNAFLQEYGSGNRPAQPFFWPAYRSEKKRMRAAITRAVARAVKRVNR